MALDENARPPLSASWFNMWRALLAIAWADGSCGKEELAYFSKVFDNLDRFYTLKPEQRDALAQGLEQAEDPWPLVASINEPEVRDHLVLYAQDLVKLDGTVDPSEEEVLERLEKWYHPDYDRDQLREEMRKVLAADRAQRAREKAELRQEIDNMNPLYAAVDRLCLAMGIDLIE